MLDILINVDGNYFERIRSNSKVDDCKKCSYKELCRSIPDDLSCKDVEDLYEND